MPQTLEHLNDLDALEARLPELTAQYAAGEPYPHITLEGLLRPEVLEQVYAEFDAVPAETWTNYLHLNERKYGHTDPSTWGPTLRGVLDELSSDRFIAFLSAMTGIEGLQADRSLDGGGLHRSLPGGFLNVHADFTAHHTRAGWRRRVNLLLYLNREWQPEWGGALELWSRDMRRCVSTVEPIGNRALVFTTDVDSYHGHPEPLRFPEGLARQSLALYYFTDEPGLHPRSTDYRARPGDGPKRALIFLDKSALRVYDALKRRLHLSDGVVSRALGAVMARRSRR